jgi:hypothetical protein
MIIAMSNQLLITKLHDLVSPVMVPTSSPNTSEVVK